MEKIKSIIMSKYMNGKVNQSLHEMLMVANTILVSLVCLEEEGLVMLNCEPENIVIEFTEDGTCQIHYFDLDEFYVVNGNRTQMVDSSLPEKPIYIPLKSVENKLKLITRSWNSAYAGIFLYYCIINGQIFENFSIDGGEDLKRYSDQIAMVFQTKDSIRDEIIGRFPSISKAVLDQLVDLFDYIFSGSIRVSCIEATHKMQKILETYEREHPTIVKAKESKMKEEANDGIRFIDMERSFLLLDRYPVFKYMENNDLEVAIIGDHCFIKSFFKVLVACAQIMDSQGRNVIPKIKLLVKKPANFLGMLRRLPELSKCVSVCLNKLEVNLGFELDTELSEQLLAEINVFDSALFSLTELGDPRYYIVMCNNLEENREIVSEIVRRAEKRTFIAYMTDENDNAQVRTEGKCDLFPIYDTAVLSARDSEDQNTLLFKAYLIERYYNRDQYLNLSDSKMWNFYEEKFRELPFSDSRKIDLYSCFSSMRTAATLDYKIFSLHEDTMARNESCVTPLRLKTLLTQEDIMLKLMVLEHRSWSAWLIVNGWQRPATYMNKYGISYMEDAEPWIQDMFEKRGKYHNSYNVHTALVACTPTVFSFDGEPKDSLDLASIRNREAIKELVEKNKTSITDDVWENEILREARKLKEFDDPSKNIPAILDCMNSLRREIIGYEESMESIWDKSTLYGKVQSEKGLFARRSAANIWQDCVLLLKKRLIGDSDAKNIVTREKRFIESVQNFYKKLMPSLEYKIKRDFKQSDCEMIASLPGVLTSMKDVCIHRPVTTSLRDNIFGILKLEPRLVVLINQQNMEEKEFIIQCDAMRRTLDSFGRDTIVYLMDEDSFLFSDEPYHVLDMTGVDDFVDGIEEFSSKYKNSTIVETDSGICKPYKDKSRDFELFSYDMKMTVNDARMLAGLEMDVFTAEIKEKEYKKEVFDWLIREGQFNDLKMNVTFGKDGNNYQLDFVATMRRQSTKTDVIYLFKAFKDIIPDIVDIRELIEASELFERNCIPVIITAKNRFSSAHGILSLQKYIKDKHLGVELIAFKGKNDLSGL